MQDRASWAVTIDRDLSKSDRDTVLGQLAELLGIPDVRRCSSQYESDRQSPLEPAVVALDVTQPNRLAILQDPQDYPGVHVMAADRARVPARTTSPRRCSATSARSRSDELARLQEARATKPATRSGSPVPRPRSKRSCAASRGSETIEVDPTGQQVGEPVKVDHGHGRRHRVPHDRQRSVQTRGGERARGRHPRRARPPERPTSRPGYATFDRAGGRGRRARRATTARSSRCASNPTYPPTWWVGGISNRQLRRAQRIRRATTRSLNRATQGQYAPGSTFKLVTSLAMTKTAIRGIGDYYTTTARSTLDGTTFHNANDEPFGPVNLAAGAHGVERRVLLHGRRRVLERLEERRPRSAGSASRHEARELGFGAPTGIELDEADGPRPRPGVEVGVRRRQLQDARRSSDENGMWYPGDDIFSAVGQGDVVRDAAAARQRVRRVRERRHAVAARTSRDGSSTRATKTSRRTTPKAIRHVAFDPTVHATMHGRASQGAVAQSDGHRVPRRSRASRSASSRSRARPAPRRCRARATRRCSPGCSRPNGNRSTSWSPWSSRPASARRPRRRSCARSSSR